MVIIKQRCMSSWVIVQNIWQILWSYCFWHFSCTFPSKGWYDLYKTLLVFLFQLYSWKLYSNDLFTLDIIRQIYRIARYTHLSILEWFSFNQTVEHCNYPFTVPIGKISLCNMSTLVSILLLTYDLFSMI